MKPVTRLETLVQAIIEGSDLPFSAVDRIEMFLSGIITGQVSSITPVTRLETYLAKISGADVTIPVPVTRLEFYLAAIAGMDVDVPDPVTREELFLAEWVGSVHTYGPAALVSFETSRATLVKSLLIAIQPIQDLHGYSSPWIGNEHDAQPYNFRAISDAGVSQYGNSEFDTIIGGTVAWNQLAPSMGASKWQSGNSSSGSVSFSDGIGVLTATARGGRIQPKSEYNDYTTKRIGHVILGIAKVKLTTATTDVCFEVANKRANTVSTSEWQTLKAIKKTTSEDTHNYIAVIDLRNSDFDDIQVKDVNSFDLTQMFGSTIADYIYSLEQANTGAGVAKLKSWGFCTAPYYAYDAGSLQSVNTSAHKTYNADSTILGNYALDGSLTLRGVPKLDAANKLYYDGDAYLASGAVVRKYGVADLGSLSWNASASPTADGSTAYVASISDMATDGSNQDMVSDVCVPGPTKWVSGMTVNTMIRNAGSVIVAASAAPTAGHLIYPLATPTTESADPYAAIQSIDPDGTEEYVDAGVAAGTRDAAIPVGHDTVYANICPISGRTGLSVYVSPTQDVEDATTYAEDWTSQAGTVYGGSIEVVSGSLKARPHYASYNGETLVGPWLSSMDAYASGTTPTTGAQVVDLGGTETEYALTPQTITTLIGQNYVWADTGDVSVTVRDVVPQ